MHHVSNFATIVGATFFALSGVALASDMKTGYQESDGYITQSTCGSLSSSLAVGAPVDSWAVYPGAGKTGFVLATPATSSSGSAGSASTQVCTTTAAVPSGGLNGASLTFSCYADTVSGPASSPQAQLQSKFKMGASHSVDVKQVTTTANLIVNGVNVCNFTSDATWTLE
jgi:hypothetical protein